MRMTQFHYPLLSYSNSSTLLTAVLEVPARHVVSGRKHLQSTAANDSPATTAQLKPKAFHWSSYFKVVLAFHIPNILIFGCCKCKRHTDGTQINAGKESLLGKYNYNLFLLLRYEAKTDEFTSVTRTSYVKIYTASIFNLSRTVKVWSILKVQAREQFPGQ